MKFAATVLSVVILVAAIALAQPNQYPDYVGYVNDFAGVITSADNTAMTGKIVDFKKLTGIEVAVVTVKTTGEQPIEDYIQGLWEKWKVGKVGRDNGVIFLVANHDRASRLQVGYGLEPYLTDGTAGEILRDVARPFFKQLPPDYSAGISAGVDAIIAKLGPKTFAERVAEQKAAAEQSRREREEFDRRASIVFTWLFSIAGLVAFIGVIWAYFSRKSGLKRSIRSIRMRIPELLGTASNIRQQAETALRDFQSSHAQSAWQHLADELTLFATTVSELAVEHPASKEPLPFSNTELRVIDNLMQQQLRKVENLLTLLARIAKRRKEVEGWREESVQALASLPEEMSRLQTLLSLPKLSEKARPAWEQACAKFGQAKMVSGGYMVDWIEVCGLLREVRKLLDQFRSNAKPAARAWKHSSGGGQSAEGCDLLDAALVGAAVVAIFGDNLEPASYSSGSGSTYETPSSTTDTFGGFGGGGSGGGGATDRW